MKNINLILLDDEPAYGKRLAEYLSGHRDSPFLVHLFLEHPGALDKAGSGDIYAVSSSLCALYADRLDMQKTLVLNEKSDQLPEPALCLYKYQSAENIYQELIRFCLEKGQKKPHISTGGKNFTTDAVYLPLANEENCLALSSLIKRKTDSRKILYLDLKQVPLPDPYPADPPDEKESFSDVIYYLKQYSDSTVSRVSSLICPGRPDYIRPPELISEIYELTQAEWEDFFETVRDDTGYEILLLDFGSAVPPTSVLTLCSRILILSRDNAWEQKLIASFRAILEKVGGQALTGKIKKLRI